MTYDPLPQTLGYDCCWLNLTLGNQGMSGSSLIEAALKIQEHDNTTTPKFFIGQSTSKIVDGNKWQQNRRCWQKKKENQNSNNMVKAIENGEKNQKDRWMER
jgi:hypothetical protein